MAKNENSAGQKGMNPRLTLSVVESAWKKIDSTHLKRYIIWSLAFDHYIYQISIDYLFNYLLWNLMPFFFATDTHLAIRYYSNRFCRHYHSLNTGWPGLCTVPPLSFIGMQMSKMKGQIQCRTPCFKWIYVYYYSSMLTRFC